MQSFVTSLTSMSALMLYRLCNEGICATCTAGLHHAKPCRAALRCAVLCCAVLCCAVLCTIAHDLTCLGCTVALNLCAGCSKRRSVLPTPWNRWQRSQDHVKAWSRHAAHVPSPDTPQRTPPRRAAAGRSGLCPLVRLCLVMQMVIPHANMCIAVLLAFAAVMLAGMLNLGTELQQTDALCNSC